MILLVTLTITNNAWMVNADLLSGRAARFDSEMNNRYKLLIQAGSLGAEEIRLNNLTVKPKSLSVYDISCNPDNWINKSYAGFYGLKRVRLKTCE